MAYSGTDRRRAQRVEANLRLMVRMPRADGSERTAELETVNISTSGAYFLSDHFIEPMTKLAMGLELAVPAAGGGEEEVLVDCEGLVVRTEPEREVPDQDSYEIAVFFTTIAPNGLEALERHIDALLERA
jgi:hypothetical protein